MVVYFSGTGNSRFAARLIAERLGDGLTDAGLLIKKNSREPLASERPWVFVCPTYAWRMPKVFEKWLLQTELSGSTDAYFVLTCGSDIAAAGKYAEKFCADKGLRYRGIKEVVMPENYIAMFPVPGEAEALTITEKAVPAILSAADCIAAGTDLPERPVSAPDRVKSGAVNDKFYRLFVKADGFKVSDKCIGCGKCAELCPLNNVELHEGRPVWGKNCTHCMACICFCPAEAIEYGKKSVGKRRYKCPEVNVK